LGGLPLIRRHDPHIMANVRRDYWNHALAKSKIVRQFPAGALLRS
jgi:hypothetical protein